MIRPLLLRPRLRRSPFRPARAAGGGPVFVPVDHDPFAGSGDAPSSDTGSARPLTIRGVGRQALPPAPADDASAQPTLSTPIAGSAPTLGPSFAPSQDTAPTASAPPTAAAPADVPPGNLSYDEAFPSPTSHPGGALSNSSDDGYLSGAAKGTATALVKAASDIPGMFGSAMDMGDYLVARAQAKITGQPLDDVLAAQAAERKASADNPGWSRYLDPRNFLPSGQQIAAPVLAQTGEYVPTSETGRLAHSRRRGCSGQSRLRWWGQGAAAERGRRCRCAGRNRHHEGSALRPWRWPDQCSYSRGGVVEVRQRSWAGRGRFRSPQQGADRRSDDPECAGKQGCRAHPG